MWDLPGPGLEPVSPALAGEFLTTEPPGKPCGEVLTALKPKASPLWLPTLPGPALLALSWVPPVPLLPSVPGSSEEVERYLGQGGIVAIEVKVLAAVEGDGEGAAEAEHGGGLWEGGVGVGHQARGNKDPEPTDFCPPVQLKGQRQRKMGPSGCAISTPFSPGAF